MLGMGTGALLLPGLSACSPSGSGMKIGYTLITWGYSADVLEEAVKQIAALGYHSFETFGWVMEEWENEHGGIGRLIEDYGSPFSPPSACLMYWIPARSAKRLKSSPPRRAF